MQPMAAQVGKEYLQVFHYFDKDGDGKISPAELGLCMMSTGEELSGDELEAMISSVDSDGNGLLDFKEFVELMDVDGSEEKRNRDLREAFRMYEMEGCGCITPKSLKKMLHRLGDLKSIEECKAMICKFDLDGDGVLSFEEFKVMMV